REAATKELTGMGARVRPQLEAAMKSSVPEVRFRSDQILRKIDGQRRERRLGDDPAVPRPPAAGGFGGGGFGGGFSHHEYEKIMKQFEEQMEKLREQADKGFGQGRFRFDRDLFGSLPGFGGLDLRGARGARFHAEGADLLVTPRSARLALVEKAPDGSPV